ncbi:Ppx/GppA phosphatase family protein [Pedobacter sp. AW31-3R]|uniref:Ppx/GppA phosphatase family protein n=1 Tax=Pedobacter sp. AW31-3R TaxID=3445781 RepID=UPI003F9EE0D5
MKAAVIDLGTNTFHLIIAEITGLGVEVLFKTNVPVRLGEGRINDHVIIPEAFARGIQTLKDFKGLIDEHQVSLVRATATSAVRSAKNGPDFVKSAAEDAGIDIEVITGEQEAAYIFRGVKATGVITQTSLIMDIGGGSTEFIICTPEKFLWKKSYNIGAARLMQAYFHTDPISAEEKEAILNLLQQELPDLKAACQKYQPKVLVGSAGAFETFAAMLLKESDVKHLRSAELDIEAYRNLSVQLIGSTHEERTQMPDLISLRVDMIVIAALITSFIIEETKPDHLSLSTYDLKMGVLYSLWDNQKDDKAV